MTSSRILHRRFASVWDNLPGWGNLAAVNHTSIGCRFMLTGAVYFIIGGLLAMLIRTQLALPELDLLPADKYAQVFTMHGTVMMFLFAIPILEGAAMYLVPKMIGTRDLVFPRLSAFGYYCYLFGGIIIMSSLVLGVAPDAGWFMYTPLSSTSYSAGPGSDFWLLGVTFVEISAVSAGVELTVSILRTRAPGMTLSHMPIFCWYILAMALMIVFGFPPLILASILLELERAAGMPFFTPEAGGDPLLWQHLFWLFGHPEVYIIFLPAAGIVSTIIPVFSGRSLVGYRWVVMSVIMTAFISFGLWVHHMFTVGIPQLAQAFFSVASMLVAIPTGIQVFVWIATLWTGKVRFELPMLWIFGFLIIFVCGGLTGVMLALVPFDLQVHDTHFVVAHFHYVLIGGMLFPLIAGLYYWLPHFSGRMPSLRMGKWAFWLTFAGFNLTFLLMHLTGLLGMPRRIYTYQTGFSWDELNMLSTVGGFIFAVGIGILVLDVLLHFKFGHKAPDNPWHADTLEWATGTPPTSYNFASIPTIRSRHPLWDEPSLMITIPQGEHGLSSIAHGRRELYGTDAITGALKEVIHIPSHSWWPLISAATLAVVCVALLIREYALALVFICVAGVCLFCWSWVNGAHEKMAPHRADQELRNEPPLHSRTKDGPGLWGMTVTLLANGSLFISLLFGWLYMWTVAPTGATPSPPESFLYMMGLTGIPLTAAWTIFRRAKHRLYNGNSDGLARQSGWALLFVVIHLTILLFQLASSGLQITQSAQDAAFFLMLCYVVFHSGLLVSVTGLQLLRIRKGYISDTLPYELGVMYPFWLYTVAIFWLSYAIFIFLPEVWQRL